MASTTTWTRRKPYLPPLALPDPPASFEDDFPEQFDPDNVDETPEYNLDLGAESPTSLLYDETLGDTHASPNPWVKSGIAVHTNVPPRQSSWRSSSFSEKRKGSKKDECQWNAADRDCGICFEVAVSPTRVSCCGKLFCHEHLSDWLNGSSSDGRCPSCEAPCSLGSDTRSLASPPVNIHNSCKELKQPKPLRPSQRPQVLLFDQQIKEGNLSRPPSVSKFHGGESRSRSLASSSSVSSSSSNASSTPFTSVSSWTSSTSLRPRYSHSTLALKPRSSLSPYTPNSDDASRTHSPLLSPFFATYAPSSPLPASWATAAAAAVANATGLSKALGFDPNVSSPSTTSESGENNAHSFDASVDTSTQVGLGREVNVITGKILSIVGLTLVFYILLS